VSKQDTAQQQHQQEKLLQGSKKKQSRKRHKKQQPRQQVQQEQEQQQHEEGALAREQQQQEQEEGAPPQNSKTQQKMCVSTAAEQQQQELLLHKQLVQLCAQANAAGKGDAGCQVTGQEQLGTGFADHHVPGSPNDPGIAARTALLQRQQQQAAVPQHAAAGIDMQTELQQQRAALCQHAVAGGASSVRKAWGHTQESVTLLSLLELFPGSVIQEVGGDMLAAEWGWQADMNI
jgi:hypothetical protein